MIYLKVSNRKALMLFYFIHNGGYMSNSNLISYTKISPNKTSPRNHVIDTITIHCVVGQVTVETLGNIFAPTSKQASSNYGIGKDGKIGMYVEEKDRSWCSSNSANDNRAITIEVASDTTHPYTVTDKALDSLIKLCADICKRNNIKKLVWSINKNDRVNHLNGCNMTVHRDFKNKSCPGQYLYDRHGYIADEVNKLLGISTNYSNSVSNSGNTSSTSSNVKYMYNGLDYSPVFNPIYYANKYSDLKKAFGTNSTKLFDHFKSYGMKEGRQASENFNVIVYKNNHTDLRKVFGNNMSEYYKHYLQFGIKEGRKAT